MSIFFVTLFSILLAEIGDKTQLLTLLLIARFRKPAVILIAMSLATFVNHLIAASVGDWLNQYLNPTLIHLIIGIGFFMMAVWLFVPEQGETTFRASKPFWSSLLIFFLAEMGDKTQVATLLLAARYQQIGLVVIASTLGIIFANAPMLFFGHYLHPYMKRRWGRYSAAVIFIVLGITALSYTPVL